MWCIQAWASASRSLCPPPRPPTPPWPAGRASPTVPAEDAHSSAVAPSAQPSLLSPRPGAAGRWVDRLCPWDSADRGGGRPARQAPGSSWEVGTHSPKVKTPQGEAGPMCHRECDGCPCSVPCSLGDGTAGHRVARLGVFKLHAASGVSEDARFAPEEGVPSGGYRARPFEGRLGQPGRAGNGGPRSTRVDLPEAGVPSVGRGLSGLACGVGTVEGPAGQHEPG